MAFAERSKAAQWMNYLGSLAPCHEWMAQDGGGYWRVAFGLWDGSAKALGFNWCPKCGADLRTPPGEGGRHDPQ